jgi:hypothetical protein
MSSLGKYQIVALLHDDVAKTYRVIDSDSGQVLLFHRFKSNADFLNRLPAMPPQDLMLIVKAGEIQGDSYVVTQDLPDVICFNEWVNKKSRGKVITPASIPSEAGWKVAAAAAGRVQLLSTPPTEVPDANSHGVERAFTYPVPDASPRESSDPFDEAEYETYEEREPSSMIGVSSSQNSSYAAAEDDVVESPLKIAERQPRHGLPVFAISIILALLALVLIAYFALRASR